MATRTSKAVTGNSSTGTNWVGDVAPVDGDTIVVVVGADITINTNITLGSNTGNVGHAFTVNGTNSTTYGILRVADGISLTLRGNDNTSNTMGLINRYGKFIPAPGSTIIGDCTSDYQSGILNKGIVEAIGTSSKNITFTSPSSSKNWNNAASTTYAVGTGKIFWSEKNIQSMKLSYGHISNATGDGPGDDSAAGSTSIVLSSVVPSGLFNNRKAWVWSSNQVTPDVSVLTANGDYMINHDLGWIVYYNTTVQASTSMVANFKYLTYYGWGISSQDNNDYNSIAIDYCNLSFMGERIYSSSTKAALSVRYKYSATSAANRIFYVKNSTVRNCNSFLNLRDSSGASGDYLLIENNDFGENGGYQNGTAQSSSGTVYLSSTGVPYLRFYNNLSRSFIGPISSVGVYGVASNPQTSFDMSYNKVTADIAIYSGGTANPYRGADIHHNTFSGFGATIFSGSLIFYDVCGDSTARANIHHNIFRNASRGPNLSGFVNLYANYTAEIYHHAIMMGKPSTFYKISDMDIYNNITTGKGPVAQTHTGAIQLGYVDYLWIDNVKIYNNTAANGASGFDLSDGDAGSLSSPVVLLATNIEYDNNLIYNSFDSGGIGNYRPESATDTYNRAKHHILSMDNNLIYGSTPHYFNWNGAGTFTIGSERYNLATGKNIAGIALQNPTYSTTQSGKSLVLTVTDFNSDITIAWGGGTAVQIVHDRGTATSATNHKNSLNLDDYGTLTDSTKTWARDFYGTNSPACMWIKITGSTGSGQIRAIMWNASTTAVQVVPPWTIVPDATSTYTIYKSQVTLYDSGATEHVDAGILLSALSTTSQTDTGIGLEFHSVYDIDPILNNPSLTSVDPYDFRIQPGAANSSAVGAGTTLNAPTTDYFGSARPYNGTYDIGAHEYIDTGALLMMGM